MLRIPAPDWLRLLANETQAFEIKNVAWEKAARSRSGGAAWDCAVSVLPAGDCRLVSLHIAARASLTPRIALDLIQRLKTGLPGGVPLICSPSISPRVAEVCREGGVSYLDAAGNCRISAPGLFVQISGKKNTDRDESRPAAPFSPKSSRIARLLLTDPLLGWQVQELAGKAQISLGLASRVKQALVDQAFVEERQRRVWVRDPEALLRAWSAEYEIQAVPVPLFVLGKPKETEEKIAEWCRTNRVSYALTQFSGAWRTSPMVRYDRSAIYLSGNLEYGVLDRLQEFLGARRVESGTNLVLWLTEDPAVFWGLRETGGVNVVSALQLYLDLRTLTVWLRSRGRG